MAQNELQRKETPLGPSPNSPSLLFEYKCKKLNSLNMVLEAKSHV